MSEESHPWRCAPPWWPPPVLTERTGRTGRTHPSGTTGGTGRPGAQAGWEEKAPTGTTGRTYPSGIASPDEPERQCIAASGGDAQSSFAIAAIHRVFKQLVVRNFVLSIKSDSSETHIEPPLPTPQHLDTQS